jgi:acyl dehydratase
MTGRYFEEWHVGDWIAHPISRTVNETDKLSFATVMLNLPPLNPGIETTKVNEFGRILLDDTFMFSLMLTLSEIETTFGTLITNLGFNKLVMRKSMLVGDTLHARSEVIELKESKSRPIAGIVTFQHELINQRDEMVCRCTRTALVHRAPR